VERADPVEREPEERDARVEPDVRPACARREPPRERTADSPWVRQAPSPAVRPELAPRPDELERDGAERDDVDRAARPERVERSSTRCTRGAVRRERFGGGVRRLTASPN
jgi:hypothetical protein